MYGRDWARPNKWADKRVHPYKHALTITALYKKAHTEAWA